jgi:hypothetical protein
MTPTKIELVDMTPRWGLVTVGTPEGKILRQYRITAEQEAAVRLGGQVPHGCSSEEWASCFVRVEGRPCLPGQGVVNPDGWLITNYGIADVGERVDVRVLQVPPGEWEARGPVVYLSPEAAAVLEA